MLASQFFKNLIYKNNMKEVTEDHAMEMLEVLPPATWYKTPHGEIFQVGEAASADSYGNFIFDTYERIEQKWFYRGQETKHRGQKNIMESDAY